MMAASMLQYHARMMSRACWNGWNTSDSSRYKTKGTSLYSSFSSLKVLSLFIPNYLFREPFPMHPCKNFWGGKRSRSFWTSSWARIGEWSVMQSSSCSNIIFRLTSSWDCLPKVSYQPEIQSRWSKIRGKVWKNISSMLHLRRRFCALYLGNTKIPTCMDFLPHLWAAQIFDLVEYFELNPKILQNLSGRAMSFCREVIRVSVREFGGLSQ